MAIKPPYPPIIHEQGTYDLSDGVYIIEGRWATGALPPGPPAARGGLLVQGAMQETGHDCIKLEGDQQSGTDILLLEGDF